MDFKVPIVKALSRKDVNRAADIFRERVDSAGLKMSYPIPIMDILEFGYLKKLYNYEWRTESMQSGLKGYTEFVERELVLSEETYEGASAGNSSCLFTVAHELGHVVLHDRQMTNRLYEQKEIVKLNRGNIEAFKDPEWQANEFAAAFLMPFDQVRKILTENNFFPETEISFEFGVSDIAASIRIKNVLKELKKDPSFRPEGLF
ncbi:ImmA/IrrE family metallo-endopeptidase (plasmid) [Leptospira sp. WS92.C1]